MKRKSRAPLAGGDAADQSAREPKDNPAPATEASHPAKDAVRRKFQWLDLIAADAAISAPAFRVAYVLRCVFGDNETGECWAGLDTLAARMQVNEKTVRRAIAELAEAGYLVVKRRRNLSNIYRPEIPDRTPLSDQEPALDEVSEIAGSDILERRIGHPQGQKCPPNSPEPSSELSRAGLRPVPEVPSARLSSTVEVEKHPTLEGSRRAPEGAPPSDDLCFVGMNLNHPKHGPGVVVQTDPLKRRAVIELINGELVGVTMGPRFVFTTKEARNASPI